MRLVQLNAPGSFKRTGSFLHKMLKLDIRNTLNEYGKKGVEALRKYTPKDTGLTSESWYYEIDMDTDGASISWKNSNENDGVPIALLIQYGHGTGWGGYVPGVDYINPALKTIFDEMADSVWKEVQNA